MEAVERDWIWLRPGKPPKAPGKRGRKRKYHTEAERKAAAREYARRRYREETKTTYSMWDLREDHKPSPVETAGRVVCCGAEMADRLQCEIARHDDWFEDQISPPEWFDTFRAVAHERISSTGWTVFWQKLRAERALDGHRGLKLRPHEPLATEPPAA